MVKASWKTVDNYDMELTGRTH